MSAKIGKYKPSFGVGLTWLNDEGEKCVTVERRTHKSGKRIATLIETNWLGSIGAMHYYARIRVFAPSWSVNGDDGGHGGYGGKNCPKLEEIGIDAERILTRLEKDMNDEPLGKIGESTTRFNSPEDARKAGIAAFLKHFAAGWVLMPEYQDDDSETLLAET